MFLETSVPSCLPWLPLEPLKLQLPFSALSPDFMGQRACWRLCEASLDFFPVVSMGREDSKVSCHLFICCPHLLYQGPLFAPHAMIFERCLSLDAKGPRTPWISSYLSAHPCLIDVASLQRWVLG